MKKAQMINQPSNTRTIACHECDLLVELNSQIESDQSAHCSRCHQVIFAGHRNPLDYVVALSFTALALLVFANSFPFLAFEVKGQSRSINLIHSAQELYEQGFPVIAGLVFSFIILLPLVYLISMLILTVPIKLGIKRSPPIMLGKFMSVMLPWVMTEVFLVGVLVALIKIVAMANIILGVAFWAYIGFTMLFIYISNVVNPHRLWRWVDPSSSTVQSKVTLDG
jgi:paraquat-inducible protein A